MAEHIGVSVRKDERPMAGFATAEEHLTSPNNAKPISAVPILLSVPAVSADMSVVELQKLISNHAIM